MNEKNTQEANMKAIRKKRERELNTQRQNVPTQQHVFFFRGNSTQMCGNPLQKFML